VTDAQQIAEIQRLGREVSRLAARVDALEKAGTVVAKLDEIRGLLSPLATHSERILAVQAGALGVR
jgi:hypothetical protein